VCVNFDALHPLVKIVELFALICSGIHEYTVRSACFTDNDCLEDSAARLFKMYFFSLVDVNLLVAGVLLATTAHTISIMVDDMPKTYYIEQTLVLLPYGQIKYKFLT